MSGIAFLDGLGQIASAGARVVQAGIEEYAQEIDDLNKGILLFNILTIGTIASAIFGILAIAPELILSFIGCGLLRFHMNESLTARINSAHRLLVNLGIGESFHGGDSFLWLLKRPINIY